MILAHLTIHVQIMPFLGGLYLYILYTFPNEISTSVRIPRASPGQRAEIQREKLAEK